MSTGTPTPSPLTPPSKPPSGPLVGGRLPGLRVPTGTLLNDVVALATAVVAILKAFGVI